MKGWQIFTHSVRQVFGNMNGAIRVSGLLYLVQIVATLGIGGLKMMDQQALQAEIEQGRFPWMVFILVMLISSVSGLWIAVGWHRYVLLIEEPGLLPAFHGGRMLGYFGKGILIGLIMIIPGIIVGIVIGLIGALVASRSSIHAIEQSWILPIIFGAVFIPLLMIGMRLSAMLPGAALQPNVSVWSGWHATAGENGTFFVLALLLIVADLIIGLVPLAFGGSLALIVIWHFVLGWVGTMVGVSILTTLYGHYIEKRALV